MRKWIWLATGALIGDRYKIRLIDSSNVISIPILAWCALGVLNNNHLRSEPKWQFLSRWMLEDKSFGFFKEGGPNKCLYNGGFDRSCFPDVCFNSMVAAVPTKSIRRVLKNVWHSRDIEFAGRSSVSGNFKKHD